MADEKQKYANIRAALGDPKTRTIYIGGLVIVIVIGLFAYWSISAKKSAPRGGPASEVSRLPDLKNAPPTDGAPKTATPVYDKLVEKENAHAAEQAKAQGGSAVPALRNTPEQKQAAAQPQSAVQPTPQYQDTRQEEERNRQAAITARTNAMKSQVNLLITAWAPKDHINLPAAQKDAQRSGAQGQGGGGTAQAAAVPAVAPPCQPVRKAGDTCYAELDTAVNTDEPSPITATIRQCGELDDSKLVGKVEVPQSGQSQVAQKAVLRFTDINVPGQPTSIPTNAVAIDEATRRTALASDVDNHYFLRYGALFASGFLAGFGEALLKGGQDEQIVTTQTGAVVQRKAYDTKQLVMAGIGNVGKQTGSNMSSVFNRPATIKIDAKIGIGILFMNDLTLKTCS